MPSTASSILNVIRVTTIETVKLLSKEDTDHKRLKNLGWAQREPDESSAFAEISAKRESVACPSRSD
jgi:hypothetical protein